MDIEEDKDADAPIPEEPASADGAEAEHPGTEAEVAPETPSEGDDDATVAEAGESGPGGEDDDNDGEEPGEEGEDGTGEPDGPVLPLASVVEAVLFAAREPLKASQIARAVGRGVRQSAVHAAMEELNLHYLETSRAFEIAEISGRFQLMSRPEYVNHIMRIYPKRETGEKEKRAKLSPSALDTLAIIAYKQPVTRGEIEHIRGVGCGPVLRALIERGTVKVAGKRADLIGQPLMYGTTEAFLAEFGLGSLDELPMRNDFMTLFPEAGPSVSLLPSEPGTEGEEEDEPGSPPEDDEDEVDEDEVDDPDDEDEEDFDDDDDDDDDEGEDEEDVPADPRPE